MRKQSDEQLGILEELELVHGMHQMILQLLQDLGFSPPDEGHQIPETDASGADALYDERRADIYKGFQDVVAEKEKLEVRIASLKKEDVQRRGQQSGVQKKTIQARKARRKGNKWTKAKRS
ncbi:hypothetical protein BBK36DRAFT_1155216 [Trichoderma citrinoviride]|uniref:Uncharacterized protein n=1 Tax=Trichoderma citrinoviride TaxID=58853 RepID=A0A2T4BMB7_9HYPO|nr:hypothetical protein BBK36DRAFT_1155216 [Trichoderma citrinoviride]PTB70409.1 hypothetical protein BBK36DRAFT_1155216 [Trichoderma citrinoviride]